jgi:hypothetical protein
VRSTLHAAELCCAVLCCDVMWAPDMGTLAYINNLDVRTRLKKI